MAKARLKRSWFALAGMVGTGRFMRCVIAVAVGTMFVLPADARAKKQKQRAPAVVQTQQVPSLDGRITGWTRTCGFDTLQYDGLGVPYGPYCH
jgi:hypothetical protein